MATAASLVATVVSARFSVRLLQRWWGGGRANRALLAWGISLTMFSLASAMLLLGTVVGWTSVSFRTFYLFGAVLNVPWLALGSTEINAGRPVVARVTGAVVLGAGLLFADGLRGEPDLLLVPGALLGLVWGAVLLVGRPAVVRIGSAVVVLVLTVLAVAAVVSAPLTAQVAAEGLPEGRDLFPSSVRGYAVGGNAVGAIIVIVSAIASSAALVWQRPPRGSFAAARAEATRGYTDVLARWVFAGRRGAPVRNLVRGNLLIALGVLLAAAGGAFSFLGETTGHAVGLGIGVTVMFLGFVRTSRPGSDVPRVRLYTRERCGLCERAEALVAEEARGAEVELVDIDTSDELVKRFGLRVPVVEVDGVEVAEAPVEPGQVRRAVTAARRARRRGSEGSGARSPAG